MNSQLCGLCQAVTSAPTWGEHAPYHSSAQLFKDSAQMCRLCAIVWDAYIHSQYFTDFETSQNVEKVYFVFQFWNFGWHESPNSFRWSFSVVDPHKVKPQKVKNTAELQDHEVEIIANIQPVQVDASDDCLPVKTTGTTGDTDSIRQIGYWIKNCQDNHSDCHNHVTNLKAGFAPKRLLNVGTLQIPELRLEMKSSKPSLRYMTLSHCWGENPGLIKKLKLSNIDKMMQTIEMAELTKTFQEAIEVTRRLGIDYVWIDSLCIIQDSKQDWQEQAAVMGEIYRNGWCNLAATAGLDGRAGLFFPRHGCCVELQKLSGGTMGLYNLVSSRVWLDGVTEAPLNKRAWVVQERVLSPRNVHFSHNQLFWECQELDACELCPKGIPDVVDQWDLFFKSLDGAAIRQKDEDSVPTRIRYQSASDQIDPFWLWAKYVRSYSVCSLTMDEDKLIAISAIARDIQQKVKDEYLAGLWKRRLPEHLLWRVYLPPGGNREPQRPKVYCAPSWSWASITADVRLYSAFPIVAQKAKIQILESKVELVNPANMFGQVSGGYLKIRGWLRTFTISSDKFIIKNARTYYDIDAEFDEGRKPEPSDWVCMPILEHHIEWNIRTLGLILQPTGKADEYQRAGYFMAVGYARFKFSVPNYPIQDDATNENRDGPIQEIGMENKEESEICPAHESTGGESFKQESDNRWSRRLGIRSRVSNFVRTKRHHKSHEKEKAATLHGPLKEKTHLGITRHDRPGHEILLTDDETHDDSWLACDCKKCEKLRWGKYKRKYWSGTDTDGWVEQVFTII